MKRRENLLPEWTRLIWASEAAKQLWEPRIWRIGQLLGKLELLTVERGHRRAAWIFVEPDELEVRIAELADRGLLLSPCSRVGVLGQSYSSTGLPYQAGQPWRWRALVVHADVGLLELAHAFIVGDNETMGAALGYPRCCRAFFDRVWVEEKWLDTTWPMADRESDPDARSIRFDLGNRWPANILGRWAGVRAVPWLPCSFTCEATRDAWIESWLPCGLAVDVEAVGWLETLLRASWRWSALHGIAEIETSIFKISTRTDVCDELHAVECVGPGLEAGSSGTRFPYHEPEAPKLTKGKSFAAGLAVAAGIDLHRSSSVEEAVSTWEQNGFSTREAMETCHDVLLEALRQGYEPAEGGRDAKTLRYLIDPGCGNGILLEKLGALYPHVVGCGIECLRDRAIAAYERLEQRRQAQPWLKEERVVFGSLAILDNWRRREYDLVLVMPGRLLELEAIERAGVLYYLRLHARRLLVYTYDAAERDDLEAYARRAGLLEDWQAYYQIVEPGAAAAAVCCPRAISS